MEERRLTGKWEANRVLENFLRFADNRGKIKVSAQLDDSPSGIEERRFLAAMKAYGKEENLFHEDEYRFPEYQHLISKTCSEDKMNELYLLLKQNSTGSISRYLDEPDILKGVYKRALLFRGLFLYRKSLYNVEKVWSGVLECPPTMILAYEVTTNLNRTQIKAVIDVIDRMLVLLMGDDYDKSFTEEELLSFGYPDVTDYELYDMYVD